MSIPPNSGPDRCDVHVLEQARHQARHDNEHACGSGLSNERDNVIGFLAFNGQRQIFAVLKQICFLLAQAQSSPDQIQLDLTARGIFK